MLSFAEPSYDWPLTSVASNGGLGKNSYPKNYYRRSMSMPSDTSSDCASDRDSPVDELRFEEVFKIEGNDSNEEKKEETMEGDSPESETKSVKVIVSAKVAKKKSRGEKDKNEDRKKKRKKWKKTEMSDFGFNTSLLPRPTKPVSHIDEDEVHKVLDTIDKEYLEMEEKTSPFEHLERLEGNKIEDKYVRDDRDRKVQKAHKQIKDKHCQSILNNDGRKKLYVHHRIMKLMQIPAIRDYLHYPQTKARSLPVQERNDVYVNNRVVSRAFRPAPVQNLNHALDNGMAVDDLPTDLVSLLITLQHRDISPEDYDMLLRLDESVAPKTISENILDSFKTDVVDDKSAGEICSICMECYEVGQKRKFLPCEHGFHGDCIDMWLKNSSMNCPLDGLPVDS